MLTQTLPPQKRALKLLWVHAFVFIMQNLLKICHISMSSSYVTELNELYSGRLISYQLTNLLVKFQQLDASQGVLGNKLSLGL